MFGKKSSARAKAVTPSSTTPPALTHKTFMAPGEVLRLSSLSSINPLNPGYSALLMDGHIQVTTPARDLGTQLYRVASLQPDQWLLLHDSAGRPVPLEICVKRGGDEVEARWIP